MGAPFLGNPSVIRSDTFLIDCENENENVPVIH